MFSLFYGSEILIKIFSYIPKASSALTVMLFFMNSTFSRTCLGQYQYRLCKPTIKATKITKKIAKNLMMSCKLINNYLYQCVPKYFCAIKSKRHTCIYTLHRYQIHQIQPIFTLIFFIILFLKIQKMALPNREINIKA